MSLTINTNAAAVTASYNLSRNNAALQKSLSRLSSGKRIVNTPDDAGGLAVSMKLSASVNRLQGVANNIQNAISYLDVQDGVLQGAASILSRMAELKTLNQDVLKNSSDIANYNTNSGTYRYSSIKSVKKPLMELVCLLLRLQQELRMRFFGGTNVPDNTVGIYTTASGSAGPIISISKATLLSAITLGTSDMTTNLAFGASEAITLAVSTSSSASALSDIATSFFTQAIQNIATLRAENGGTSSRFGFALEQANRTRATLSFANGRIIGVDIASESTRLAKYSILVQASAAMLAQANTTPNAALMLPG